MGGSLAACFTPCNWLSQEGFGPPIWIGKGPNSTGTALASRSFPSAYQARHPTGRFHAFLRRTTMAYERYPARDPRDQRSRWRDEDRERGGREERGFFERAGDEVASWFGDEEAERRRREDEMRDQRSHSGHGSRPGDHNRNEDRGYGRDYDRDRSAGPGRYRDWNDNRGAFARGGSSERDYDRDWRSEYAGRDFDRQRADREGDRGWTDRYQPITGHYGRGSGGSRA